jgi:glycosyltransferase involved in cell wall biosynthesis
MTNQALVSVIIITYNSDQYIVESLESVKRQTYMPIELIVTDDGSNDNTIHLCSKWIGENKERFYNTSLVTTPRNTGIPGNCNRGLSAAGGEWIKIIAGDDILLDTCISDYMKFISNNECNFVFAHPAVIVEPENPELKLAKEKYYSNSGNFFKLNAWAQFRYLMTHDLLMNPATLFCRRTVLELSEGFDERYACEDLPLYLKVTYNGYQLAMLEKETVIYRVHDGSLSFKGQTGLINVFWFKEYFRVRKEYFSINLFLKHPLMGVEFLVQYAAKYVFIFFGNNRKYAKILHLMRMTSPVYSYTMLRKKIKVLL